MMIISQRTKKRVRGKSVFLIALTIGSGTINAEEFDVTGVIESVNSHTVQPITESHIILLASMDETVVPKDEDSPWQGATGPCAGAVEIKEGKITGNGLCTFTDSGNDRFVISWTAQSMNEQGGPVGLWELIAGNGKYANATADGTYNDVPGDSPAQSTISLTGQLTIP